MRGFTILLVVMTHVTIFGLGFYGSDTFSYREIAESFYMPLFFFISVFVLYKAGMEWSLANSWMFLKGKVSFLLIAPLLFMLAIAQVKGSDMTETLFSNMKGGYWFTFSLFEYFLIYAVSLLLVQWLKMSSWLEDVFLFVIAMAIYLFTVWPLVMKYHLTEGWGGLLCVPNLHYYLFLVLGTRVRKYYSAFERLLDSKYFTAVVVVIFVISHIVPSLAKFSSTVYNLMVSLSGVLLIYALFRRYQDYFCVSTYVGRIMQFVGRRTLDVYLIHYFFIYSNLTAVLPNFAELNSPFIELLVSFALAVVVVACCLPVSAVLRLNPYMAHWLFGEKQR